MTYNELCEAILTAREEMLKYKVEANSVTLNGRKYGRLIENCPPNMKPTIFGMAVKADYSMPDGYDFLVQCEPPQPQTNADRIRAMSDEELADSFTSRCCPEKDEFYNCGEINKKEFSWDDCKSCWLDWLKAPVEVEE